MQSSSNPPSVRRLHLGYRGSFFLVTQEGGCHSQAKLSGIPPNSRASLLLQRWIVKRKGFFVVVVFQLTRGNKKVTLCFSWRLPFYKHTCNIVCEPHVSCASRPCHHNRKGSILPQHVRISEGLLPLLCLLKEGFLSSSGSIFEHEVIG